MLGPLISLVSGAKTPLHPVPARADIAPQKDKQAEQLAFAQHILQRSVPLAADGKPLWDDHSFSTPADDSESRPLDRQRRASLRPRYRLLPVREKIGNTMVGNALQEYGRTLWSIKQNKSPRLGVARKIRMAAVKALGGAKTERAKEFTRRCWLISRYVRRLQHIKDGASRIFPAQYEAIVDSEIRRLLMAALVTLSAGEVFDDHSGEELKSRIECRIEREQRDCITWPLYWAWSHLWC